MNNSSRYYSEGGVTIHCGDSAQVLRCLPPESVHCCVTSPPYDDLRTYAGHAWDFEAIATELGRVLAPGGIICWNVGDSVVDGSESLTSFKQALYFRHLGLRIHDTMIWSKPNFSNPEKARYHQLFEYIFIITKGAPRVFNPIKDKPNKYPKGPWGKNTYRLANGDMKERSIKPAAEFGMRGNVWHGNTVGQEDPSGVVHPAMMPKWLARDLIKSWSKPGDTILDPFLGSGTTAIQAREYGCNAIGIEINEEYCKIAVERLRQGVLITV